MSPRPLPHHRVPPGLLMVMRRGEITALARWNDRRTDNLAMEIEQWRFNVATREALLDGGATPLLGGGYIGPAGPEVSMAWSWHFPQDRRQCPDKTRCHHGCGPLAGCWGVAHCLPLAGYDDAWPLADRIAHERPEGRP